MSQFEFFDHLFRTSLVRLIAPLLLVRFGALISPRIGHFAGNTELYLCEQDAGINVPKMRYVDIFYCQSWPPVCNEQLARMWKRILHVWPSWILAPMVRINRLIPGGARHEVGSNTQQDRDIYHLHERFPAHLTFSPDEERRGETGLRLMGIPVGVPFVCLNVRDNAYLDAHSPNDWSYHNYRDSDIQNYVMAAESLANRGYFVIRMGAKVRAPLQTSHKQIIDYATNGSRSDFMDIYLGAKCEFCISVGSGFDAIPAVFRRPVVFVNQVPFAHFFTTSSNFLGITKHHFFENEGRELTLSEIFSSGAAFFESTAEFESRGIKLLENTPDEIHEVVIEMVDRLNQGFRPSFHDSDMQQKFWTIYKAGLAGTLVNGNPLHGEIRAQFGAAFLRNNPKWVA